MEETVLREMAADLGICRYEKESKLQYCNRVLYSAVISWIKASALDRPVTSVQMEYPGVSRRHIHDKVTSIWREMLKRFPEAEQWFRTEPEGESPIVVLLPRLIRHGELLKSGFETNLVLVKSSKMPFSKGIACRKGEVLLPGTYYSGMAMLQKIQELDGFQPEKVTSATAWFQEYIKRAWWKEAEPPEDMEYFNPCLRAENNVARWQQEQPRPVKGVWLTRRSIYRNAYEYFLIRKEEGLYRHNIDPFLQQIGEHRRFMIAMRHMTGHEPLAQVYHYMDHISLKLRVYLPQKESSLLETYAWPHGFVTDKLEWDMGEEVWEGIKPCLEGLGLKVTEEGEVHG